MSIEGFDRSKHSIRYYLTEDALANVGAHDSEPLTRDQIAAMDEFKKQFPKREEEVDTTFEFIKPSSEGKVDLSKEQIAAVESLKAQLPRRNETPVQNVIEFETVKANAFSGSEEVDEYGDKTVFDPAGLIVPVKVKPENNKPKFFDIVKEKTGELYNGLKDRVSYTFGKSDTITEKTVKTNEETNKEKIKEMFNTQESHEESVKKENNVVADKKVDMSVPISYEPLKLDYFNELRDILLKSGFKFKDDKEKSSYYWEPFNLEDKTTNTVSSDSKDSKFGESSENTIPIIPTGTIGSAYGFVNSRNNDVSKIVSQSKEDKFSLIEATKQYFGYLFAKRERVEGELTLKEKASKLFVSTKQKLYNSFSIIGPGPKKIVKKPLRVKLKDSLNNAKDKVASGKTKVKGLFEGIKESLSYTFGKSEKVEVKPIVKSNNGSNNTGTGKPPIAPVPPIKLEPPKPVVNENEVRFNKEYSLLEKQYHLESLKALNKLGTYEKMFVEDAKAECLDIKDNEFRQMLNERCVDKYAIFTYYCDLVDAKRQMALDYSESLRNYYSTLNLGEFERMFVEDAIAENLYPGDNEYRQMLSERCVNKECFTNFMKQYKKLAELYKEISDRQRELTAVAKVFGFNRDFKELDINTLRKLTRPRKSELTDEELKKFNASKLKKAELVEILDRTDTAKVKKLVKGDYKKDVK